MRSSVLALLLFSAVLSPALAAPTSGPIQHKTDAPHRQLYKGNGEGDTKSGLGLGSGRLLIREHSPSHDKSASWSITARELWKKAGGPEGHPYDGGNAVSGSTGHVNGGNVINNDPTNNHGMPTLMNWNSNNGGSGGDSLSGVSGAGKSTEQGKGGSGQSGKTGDAIGGTVAGSSPGMVNMNSNNGGGAGHTESGSAIGGDSVATTAAGSLEQGAGEAKASGADLAKASNRTGSPDGVSEKEIEDMASNKFSNST